VVSSFNSGVPIDFPPTIASSFITYRGLSALGQPGHRPPCGVAKCITVPGAEPDLATATRLWWLRSPRSASVSCDIHNLAISHVPPTISHVDEFPYADPDHSEDAREYGPEQPAKTFDPKNKLRLIEGDKDLSVASLNVLSRRPHAGHQSLCSSTSRQPVWRAVGRPVHFNPTGIIARPGFNADKVTSMASRKARACSRRQSTRSLVQPRQALERRAAMRRILRVRSQIPFQISEDCVVCKTTRRYLIFMRVG